MRCVRRTMAAHFADCSLRFAVSVLPPSLPPSLPPRISIRLRPPPSVRPSQMKSVDQNQMAADAVCCTEVVMRAVQCSGVSGRIYSYNAIDPPLPFCSAVASVHPSIPVKSHILYSSSHSHSLSLSTDKLISGLLCHSQEGRKRGRGNRIFSAPTHSSVPD